MQSIKCFSSIQKLESYSGYEMVQARIYEPQNLEEVQELLAFLKEKNLPFSVSGACLSFDSHCLNDRVVISSKRLKNIQLNLDKNCITVRAGTTWEEVLEKIAPLGYGPYIAPTSGKITVGGSISCDTYSRFTPSYGRESRWVRSLKVVTTNGKLISCSRHSNSDLFYGILGGLGLLAIIYEIEFEVLYVGANAGISSIVSYEDNYANLNNIKTHHDPFYTGSGMIIYKYKGKYKTMHSKHFWENTTERNPPFVHQRSSLLRKLAGVFLRKFPSLAPVFWNMAKKQTDKQPNKQVKYIDHPADMQFFMDAEIESKNIAKKVGINTKILQQSFIIPCLDGDESSIQVTRFVTYCLSSMEKIGLKPAMMDIGFMPKGDQNAFCSNPEQSSYLVSIALEGDAILSYDIAYQLFNQLSIECYFEYTGKIHLTKNILCSQGLLCKMYQSELSNLLELKIKYDPSFLLQTKFFQKYFGVQLSPPVPALRKALI